MDISYLIKNKTEILSAKNKIKKLEKESMKMSNGIIPSFSAGMFSLFVFFAIIKSLYHVVDYFQTKTFIAELFIAAATIVFVVFPMIYVYALITGLINKKAIADKEISKIINLHIYQDNFFNKRKREFLKNKIKDMTKEERSILSEKENLKYIDINPKELKESIFNYIRRNQVSEEEKETINEIVKEYKLELDKEKLDLLLFKNKKEQEDSCIVKNNIAVRKI